jgi:hypothetical protein
MTARLKRVALFGEGIYAKSPVITRQRRLNCYLTVRADGDKSKVMCLGTPGLALAFSGATIANYPMRGMIGNASALYGVAANQFISYNQNGTQKVIETLGTFAGNVGLSLNPTQVLIVDGAAGYIFTPGGPSLVTIGGAFPNGAMSATYCSGFFACELPGTNEIFVSNLNDGTTWSGLSFFAAVQAIDGIVAVDQLNGILIPFSSGHCEFWQNVGNAVEPFLYIPNSAQPYGLAAVNGRVHVGNQLAFLANTNGGSFQNATGGPQVCAISGTSVRVVSNEDVDNILQSMLATSKISDCTAYSYLWDNHLFAQFNFPTANRALLWDTTTGFWGEVQSGIATAGYTQRHLGNFAANGYGQTYVSDYASGNLYTYQSGVYTDNGNVIPRELVTKTGIEDFNTFRISQIYLDMRTGVGLSNPIAQGYAPLVQLQIARDNRDFGAPRFFSLGALGQYSTRVNSRRWGRARQATLRVYMTDPVPFEITSGAMVTSVAQGSRSTGQAATSRAA